MNEELDPYWCRPLRGAYHDWHRALVIILGTARPLSTGVLLQGGGRFKFKSKSGSNGSTKRFKRFPRGRGNGCATPLPCQLCAAETQPIRGTDVAP